MFPGDYLQKLFSDTFGDGFRIRLFQNLPEDVVTAAERNLRDTDEVFDDAQRDKTVRAVLKVSQSEYVPLSGVQTVVVTWSLSFADDIDDPKAVSAIEKAMKALTSKVNTVTIEDESGKRYTSNVGLIFSTPVAFPVQTINGRNMQPVVWSGRAVTTDRSTLADEFEFEIEGSPVTGLVSWALGTSSTGETYNSTGHAAAMTENALQSLNTTLSLDVHAVKDDAIATMFLGSLLTPDEQLDDSQAIKTYKIDVKRGDTTTPWSAGAKLAQVQTAGSVGGYIVLSLQFLRQ